MFIVFVFLELFKLIAYKYGGFMFNNLPFTGEKALSEIIPNLLFLQSWFPSFEALSWNYPSWSLSVKYYMYIIFFITLFIKSNFKFIFWFIISFLSFLMIFLNTGVMSEVVRGLSCFFAGVLIYFFYKNIQNKIEKVINKNIFSVIEILLIILVVYIIAYINEYKSIYASLSFLLTIFFFAFEKGIISNILKISFFQLLGKLSYSIYMTHAAILFCFISAAMILQKLTSKNITQMIAEVRYIDFGNIFINNFALIFVVFIVIAISIFTHRYIEVKWRDFGKSIINFTK